MVSTHVKPCASTQLGVRFMIPTDIYYFYLTDLRYQFTACFDHVTVQSPGNGGEAFSGALTQCYPLH